MPLLVLCNLKGIYDGYQLRYFVEYRNQVSAGTLLSFASVWAS
jgi:hypothetical protein